MKSLYELYLECECCAIPANTTGMGNPMPPTDTTPGSEPMTNKIYKSKKKKKKGDISLL